MLNVEFRRPGRPTVTKRLSQDAVSWGDSVDGGWTTADIRTALDLQDRERLTGSDVVIIGQAVHFFGSVAQPVEEGVGNIKCVGWQDKTAFTKPTAALYCDTRLTPWSHNRGTAWNNTAITFGTSESTLQYLIPPGSYSTGNLASGIRDIPSTTNLRLTFTFARPTSNAVIDVYVRDGTTYGAASYTAATVGAHTVDVSGTDLNSIVLGLRLTGSYAPSSAAEATLSAVRVCGVPGVTSATYSNVLNHILNNLPVDVLPAGAAYRAWVPTIASIAEPVVYEEPSSTAHAKLTDLMHYLEYDLMWEARRVNGLWAPVPVVTPWPTEPEYIVRLSDDGIEPMLTTSDLSQLANHVRVTYQTESGAEKYVDVDSIVADGNYLDLVGMNRWHSIDAGVTSSAEATALGRAYLLQPHRRRVMSSGSMEVNRTIQSTRGPVAPWAIRPGRLLRIDRSGLAPSLARIKEVRHHGEFSATLTLDEGGDRFEIALARVMKRN